MSILEEEHRNTKLCQLVWLGVYDGYNMTLWNPVVGKYKLIPNSLLISIYSVKNQCWRTIHNTFLVSPDDSSH
ncbi:hypothetical protein H5410_006017, partial [Solanum commersonii]